MLCVVPALRALRVALPEAHITLLGLPCAASFVRRFGGYLDELLEFPGFPGIPEREFCPAALPTFLTRVQARRYDLALQMHGSGAFSTPFTQLLGAKVTAGFCLPEFCPDPRRFLPLPEREPEVRRWLRLLAFLGVPSRGERLEFPLGARDWRELEQTGIDLPPQRYVCIHPGASAPDRRWPPAAFAAVAEEMYARGFDIALTGSAEEVPLTRAVADAMRAPALDLAGRTTLGALAELLAEARLLVCNDTGVSHLAAALRVPSVVIFTGSDPARWAPLDRDLHRALVRPETGAVLAQVDELLSLCLCREPGTQLWAEGRPLCDLCAS